MYESRIDHDSIPVDVLPGVRKADAVLKETLAELEQFEVTAEWRNGRTADGRPCIFLDLSTKASSGHGPKVQEYPYPYEFFSGSDESIRRGLSGQVWYLTRALSLVIRDELKSIRKHLAEMATVGDQP
ncbi:MAG: hypothetical protein K2V38_24755 [Gemmataceae bacterium]|nr:hypothetical protein [Gemmataceae bacterium]